MATIKQKLVAKKISENVGNSNNTRLNLGLILKEAGYSESVCKTPQRVLQTKGVNKFFDNFFPEELILSKHKLLLESDNTDAVIKALDMIYKLKGLYKTSPKNQKVTRYETINDIDLENEYQRLREELKIDKYIESKRLSL